jgi:hypothetical protein
MADRAVAAPSAQGLAGRNIESSYDYIIVGAGSAGCDVSLAPQVTEAHASTGFGGLLPQVSASPRPLIPDCNFVRYTRAALCNTHAPRARNLA